MQIIVRPIFCQSRRNIGRDLRRDAKTAEAEQQHIVQPFDHRGAGKIGLDDGDHQDLAKTQPVKNAA